jgi:dethiobiotin synthetase
MSQPYFITATGTGIGKTFITAALARQAAALGRTVAAFKPVISGFDEADAASSDTGLLLVAQGLPVTRETIERISPWRFKAPLAPSMAAKLEGRTLDFDALVAFSKKALQSDVALIEGVGGVMAPLDERHTMIDWIAAADAPVLLVTGSYLGTLSHSLTALEVLENRKIPLRAVIMSETENATVPLANSADELRRWTKVPVIAVKRRSGNDWHDVKELWGLL